MNELSLNARARIMREHGLTVLPSVNEAKAALGLQVDGLGRTLAMQALGGSVNWLDSQNYELRARLVGQVGRVNSFFAKKAAVLPWTLWRKGANGKPERITDAPLLDLLWRPNPETGQIEFFRQLSTIYHGAGDAFVWANKLEDGDRAGQPTELWITTRRHMEVLGGGGMNEVTGYKFTPDLSRPGAFQTLSPDEVLHLKHEPLPGDRYGSSVILAANREATADVASITAQVSQMQNQGAPGVLWYDAVNGAPVETSDEQRRNMREQINSYATPGKRGLFPVSGSKMGWTAIGTSAVDLDIIAFRQANFRELCGYWGFSAVLLGDMEASTDNNYQNARKAMYTDAILPYLESIVAEFSRWLCPMFEPGTWLQVDTSGVPELQQDKTALVTMLAAAWWLPVKRRQEMLGEPATWTGPEYLVPAGLVPLESLSSEPGEVDE